MDEEERRGAEEKECFNVAEQPRRPRVVEVGKVAKHHVKKKRGEKKNREPTESRGMQQ